MGMLEAARRYTVEEVLAFPDDGNRYELVGGELLVTPSPTQRHQIVLSRLHLTLGNYLADHPSVGMAFFAPADVIWSRRDYVQPDLFVVPADEVTGDWRDCQNLLLAIEVVSPSSARADRVKKRRLYQERGVVTYWIVDPDAQVVEEWHPTDDRPRIRTELITWRASDEADEVEIHLSDVFADLPR
jgi:Uma2 family endonuclease